MNVAKRILGLVLVLVGLYVSIAVGGASTRITCEWIEPTQVDCTSQSAPLGIPWGAKRAYHDVQGATVQDYEGLGRNFVLEIEAAGGTTALNGEMTVNEKETAKQINAFLRDPQQDTLEVNYVDWGRLVVGVFVVGGFVGIYPGIYLLFAGSWRDLARRIDLRLAAATACLLFGAFCLFVFGRVTTLTCRRVETAQVDCRQQQSWAGMIPLDDEDRIYDLLEADVDRRRPVQKNPTSIHLRLWSREGVATAIECFTFTQAQELAQEINAFLADPEADALRVNNANWLEKLLGLTCTVLPCAILAAFALHRYSRGKAG